MARLTKGQHRFASCVVVVAFVLRVWALDWKPAHFDEGVNGAFADHMRRAGAYRYDPANFHGPLHFYVLFTGQQLFGRSLTTLRFPTVLLGTAVVALAFLFHRFFRFRIVALAAVFLAISPAMVFYSRYAIHEMWMPFFAMLACYGGFGFARGHGHRRDLWCVALGLTGMILTKETYFLHCLAALLSLFALWLFRRPRPGIDPEVKPFPGDQPGSTRSIEDSSPHLADQIEAREVLAAWGVSLGLILAFYSGFGMHWAGVSGILETFTRMAAKGTGAEEGHHKEVFYWVKLFAYYEWPALAGLLIAPFVGLSRALVTGFSLCVAGVTLLTFELIPNEFAAPLRLADYLSPDLGLSNTAAYAGWAAFAGVAFFVASPSADHRLRWLALYGLASFAAYTLIPYKTPWCIINFIWPFVFIVAHAIDKVWIRRPRQMILLTVALFSAQAFATIRLNFVNPTNDAVSATSHTQPDGDRYAYVQTSFDINKLLHPVRALIKADPRHRQMTGLVMGEAFPLIWELNNLPNIRYEEPGAVLPSYDADFLLIPDRLRELIEPQLLDIYFREEYVPRTGTEGSWLYLQAERFRSVLPADRSPEIKPRVPLTE